MSRSAVDRRIRALRPAKPYVDSHRAHGWLIEEERRPDATLERTLTVFLAGAECPFTCSFCDLWKWTIDGPTPDGAIPSQLESVLGELEGPAPDRIKLYNASNFFDRRAVPPADLPRIASLVGAFAAVTVESHASTVGPSTLAFARQIAGRLEVAMGLETIHPVGAKELNKRLDPSGFSRAAQFLSAHDIDLRVFVLLGAPHVPGHESVAWTVRTVEYAVDRGARVVSIIPVRGGNGELERLQSLGAFTPPTLRELELALDQCVRLRDAVVTADPWDIDKLPGCIDCRAQRVERMRCINLTGRAPAPITCRSCGDL